MAGIFLASCARQKDSAKLPATPEQLSAYQLKAEDRTVLAAWASWHRQEPPDSLPDWVRRHYAPLQTIGLKFLEQAGLLHNKETLPLALAKLDTAREIGTALIAAVRDSFLLRQICRLENLDQKTLRLRQEIARRFARAYERLYQSRYAESRREFQITAELAQQIRDDKLYLEAKYYESYFLDRDGRFNEIITASPSLLAQAAQAGYRSRAALLGCYLAGAYVNLHQHEAALAQFGRNIALAEQLGDAKLLARCYKNQAVIFYFQGKYPQAEAALQRVLRFDAERKFYGLTLLLQGQIAVVRGEYDRARLNYAGALNHFTAHDLDSLNVATALNRLAVVDVLTGNYENALRSENHALTLRRRTANAEETAWSLSNLALIYAKMDSLDQAIVLGRQALQLLQAGGKQTVINTWLNLGSAYLQKGVYDSARAAFHYAENLAHALNSEILMLEAKIGQGFVALKQDQPEPARALFAAALILTAKTTDANYQATALYGLSQAERKLNNPAGAANHLEEALAVVEKLCSNLSQDSIRVSYFASYQDIFDQAILLALARGREKLALHYAERARARSLRDALSAAMPAAKPSPVFQTAVPGIEALQNAIPPGVQVIEYRITPDTLIIWLIERQTLVSRRLGIAAAQIAQDVDDFLANIGAKNLAVYKQRVEQNRQAIYRENLQAGRRLYQMLWEPIAGHVARQKKLLVIPDGVLHRLPFGALVDSGGRFLAEQMLWVKAPGLAVLAENAASTLARDKTRPASMLVVADDLPSANEQAKLLSHLFADSNFLLKSAATYEALQTRLRQEVDIIYFSVHAVADERFPMNSYLELYERAAAGATPRRAKVYARELLQLEFNRTGLAVINACQTASGKIAAGEGVLNLVRVFALKKVPVVMASLWENDDRFSAEITNAFFKRVAAGDEYAVALQQARLQAIGKLQRDYAVALPYFWAFFEIYQNRWDQSTAINLD